MAVDTPRRILDAAADEFAERGLAGRAGGPDRRAGRRQQAADLRVLRQQGPAVRPGGRGPDRAAAGRRPVRRGRPARLRGPALGVQPRAPVAGAAAAVARAGAARAEQLAHSVSSHARKVAALRAVRGDDDWPADRLLGQVLALVHGVTLAPGPTRSTSARTCTARSAGWSADPSARLSVVGGKVVLAAVPVAPCPDPDLQGALGMSHPLASRVIGPVLIPDERRVRRRGRRPQPRRRAHARTSVVGATSTQDVVEAVRWAAEQRRAADRAGHRARRDHARHVRGPAHHPPARRRRRWTRTTRVATIGAGAALDRRRPRRRRPRAHPGRRLVDRTSASSATCSAAGSVRSRAATGTAPTCSSRSPS